MILKRIVFDIALVLVIIVFPWWVSLPCACILVFYFENFYEIVFAGFFLDLLESSPSSRYFGFVYFFSALSIILFFILRWFKTKIALPKF